MGKVIKEHNAYYTKVTLLRYLNNGKFRFTIEVASAVTGEISELEYLADSVFEKYEEIIQEYQFDRVTV